MSLCEKLFKKILRAKVYPLAKRTPLELARQTSREFGNEIYIKREDLQEIFSFKIRGAFNAIRNLDETAKKNGVACASAGNHAQGVAASARKLGIDALVVMPITTPAIKVNAVKSLGAKVRRKGFNVAEAGIECDRLSMEMNLTQVHPFDDENVIAGQGTVGMEIYQELDRIDYVFAPVGGGGLISGIAVYLKEMNPNIKIYGVEPEDSNSMQTALDNEERTLLKHVGKFADGVAVPRVGELPFRVCRKLLDGVIAVTEDAICSAIKRIYNECRVVVEPSGAVSMAGALKFIKDQKLNGKNIVTINSGANMNFDILRYVSRNANVGEGREILLAVDIPERPGALKQFCGEIIRNNPITEFNYRFSSDRSAKIFVGIENREDNNKDAVLNNLKKLGFDALDLSEDELSKNHLRFMIGGSPIEAADERVFLVTFPERPHALLDFLNEMEFTWNISLFQYVNNGGSSSRIFIGFQVPRGDHPKLEEFLNRSKYRFDEQTHNEGYRIFLNRRPEP